MREVSLGSLPSLTQGTITIDLEAREVVVDGKDTFSLDSPEGFTAVSRAWLRAGWDSKYVYSFTWLGRPLIQLPEDMIRLQEVIYSVQPDVIIETGVAHGGSLIFYSTLCKAMGRGRVIGIDIDIREPNRRAIEEHALRPLITLIEGSSTDPEVLEQVRMAVGPTETVMVLLDADHSEGHVLAELEAYSPLVSKESYIVAMDGIMEQLENAPRAASDWGHNNPRQAVRDFLQRESGFVVEEPKLLFNEGKIDGWVTYWPGGFLKRVS